ncbi:MAG: hypothetical protein K5922_00605 [Clostridiales bacterium]|nr:hypothetical protein [Clostridiales bacterium]
MTVSSAVPFAEAVFAFLPGFLTVSSAVPSAAAAFGFRPLFFTVPSAVPSATAAFGFRPLFFTDSSGSAAAFAFFPGLPEDLDFLSAFRVFSISSALHPAIVILLTPNSLAAAEALVSSARFRISAICSAVKVFFGMVHFSFVLILGMRIFRQVTVIEIILRKKRFLSNVHTLRESLAFRLSRNKK